MKCPICDCEHVSYSGGEFHSEDHEINGVPMRVLVLIGETFSCKNRHEWVSPVSLEEVISKTKARMQKKFTLESAVAWLEKFSKSDLLMGEQNYARLLLNERARNQSNG